MVQPNLATQVGSGPTNGYAMNIYYLILLICSFILLLSVILLMFAFARSGQISHSEADEQQNLQENNNG